MARVFFKPSADQDVAHLIYFLFGQSVETASRFHAAVEDTCRQRAESPELGAVVAANPEAIAGMRLWRFAGFTNYLIFYRPIADGVEIVRVLHAARDWLTIIESSNGT